LSAKVSFYVYGLYLYNQSQVRIWPYSRATGAHTADDLHRLRAEISDRPVTLIWDGASYHRAKVIWSAAAPASTVPCRRCPATAPI
jgi:hypothetical protein